MAKAEAVSLSMNGGSGVHSYSTNSYFQKKNIDAMKEVLTKAIDEKLYIINNFSSNTFRIADIGCATGPNTFSAVQNIIDAVESKFIDQREQGGESAKNFALPDFQVFFNDQASNDFNKLFTSLPIERRYFASGVPGSFHRRLFPSSSLHFVHSSYALHILSRVPKEVMDKSSPAWNRGRTHYSNSPVEVIKAYKAQYENDMDRFLKARAEEIVHDGLMAFVVPCPPNETPHTEAFSNRAFELLGYCLMDMANKGKISTEKVDSFNLPIYFPSPKEVEALVKQNGSFTIEIMESLPQVKIQLEAISSTMRAALEGALKDHFGGDILDELFDSIQRKAEENWHYIETGNAINLFVLLKRI